jgi:DNA-binding NtrC family response regulator
LRERKEDIVPIAERFLCLAAKRYGLPAKTLSPKAAEKLGQYHWPGNVRELRNTMDQAAVLAKGDMVADRDIDFAPPRIAAFHGSELGEMPAPTLTFSGVPEREPAGDRDPVQSAEMPPVQSVDMPAADGDHPMVVCVPLGTPVAEVERLLILKTLEASAGNKQRAARVLGISRRGLYVRLALYGDPSAQEEAVD